MIKYYSFNLINLIVVFSFINLQQCVLDMTFFQLQRMHFLRFTLKVNVDS